MTRDILGWHWRYSSGGVATAEDARRQGGAETVLRALEAWVATNAPAIALYRRLGFMPGARNRFWVKP